MSEKFLETGSGFAWSEALVFVLGGTAYGLLETLFRGYTHWTMIITGGACALTIYFMEGGLGAMPLVLASLLGAAVITAYEFCVGLVVNVGLGWDVWDYSSLPGNVFGQICPVFSMLWFCLCFAFMGGARLLARRLG